MAKVNPKSKKQMYEILPQDILEALRFDVEALKKKLEEPTNKTNELILEIESLKDSIHDLNDIFKKALHQTEDEDIYKTIHSLNERLETVQTQNETIAKGMIAISDKVESFVQSQNSNKTPNSLPISKESMQNQMRRPTQNNLPPQMQRVHQSIVPPPPGMGRPSMGGVPPPSPAGRKKRSFF